MEKKDRAARPPIRMRYIKVAVPPDMHRDLRLIAAETGTNTSHLVCEILYQYLHMPEVQVPHVRVPSRMAEKTADKAIRMAMQAPQQPLGMRPDQPPTPR